MSNTIVAEGTPQKSNDVFMAKMLLWWFCQYPGSAVQELITMPNSAYSD